MKQGILFLRRMGYPAQKMMKKKNWDCKIAAIGVKQKVAA